jgi:tetratricopeptide (TPR) repeat protein
MGFLELARGRMEAARPYYQAAAGQGFSQDTALVALALLDGQAGNGMQAAAILDAMARDPARPLALQQAAGLSAGYVRYWAGDYQGAAVAFAAVADNYPDSPLADDALYGLARSFSQLGDPESAEQVYERVNEMPAQGFDNQHVRPALRGLALREIIRATRERYGAVPLGQPEQMLIAVLDVNGRVLAHGSLRQLAKQGKRAAVGSTLAKAAQDAQLALARKRKTTLLSTDAPMGPAPTGATGSATVTKAATDDTVPTPATVPGDPAADTAHPGATHAPSSEEGGGGGGVILLLLIVGAIYLIRRRWGLPAIFRRAASRPAGR